MELTMSDIVYVALAARSMLEKDLCKADRDAYEKIWYKCKISKMGQKIRGTFNLTQEELLKDTV